MKKLEPKFNKNEKFLNYDHYVLFSGGYDSTLLLFYLLQLQKEGKIKNPINVICSYNCFLNVYKNKKEIDSRRKVFDMLHNDYGYEFNILEISVNTHSNSNFQATRNGLFQQYLFISEASVLFKRKSYLHLGYIAEDNNSYVNNLKDFMKTIDTLTNGETILSFPLILYRKENVLEDLKIINPKFLSYLWNCENPVVIDKNIKPCGYCNKCKELKKALLLLNKRNNTIDSLLNEFIKEY